MRQILYSFKYKLMILTVWRKIEAVVPEKRWCPRSGGAREAVVPETT